MPPTGHEATAMRMTTRVGVYKPRFVNFKINIKHSAKRRALGKESVSGSV
jgi:hypothetical protein